jgi:hypothetical protein
LDIKERESSLKKDYLILALMALGTLFLRYMTLMEVNVGGDNIDYWYYGKSLLKGYPYDLYFHRSVRWGIILPTLLVQMIFGIRAWVIYLPPILMSILLNYTVYWLGRRLFDRKTALLSLVIIQFFPYMIRMGSQLLLGVFSMNYILLSLLFLLKYLEPRDHDEEARGRLWFFLSLLFLFISYLTKITNLYFLFAWAIIIFRKKDVKTVILYGVCLSGFYLIEHLAYFLILDEPLGRLGIIVNTHLGNGTMEVTGKYGDGTFLGLFKRYNLEHFPLYWHFLFWGGLASSVYLLKKEGETRNSVKIILIIIGIFTVLITFGVTSLNPVKSFENYHPRYFSSLLPFLALLISRVVIGIQFPLKEKICRKVCGYGALWLFSFFLLCLFILSLFLPILPEAASQYLNNPFKPQNHMLTKVNNWEKDINEATTEGALLRYWRVGPGDNGKERNDMKSLDTVNRLYLKLPKRVGKYPEHYEILEEGKEYKWIDYGGGTPSSHNSIFTFYRKPFEMVREP